MIVNKSLLTNDKIDEYNTKIGYKRPHKDEI
jgi:hypothetical protein